MANTGRIEGNISDEQLLSDHQAQVLQLRLRRSAANHQTTTNFATPENDFFYSHSPYSELDPASRDFRILKVFARKPYVQHIASHPLWRPQTGHQVSRQRHDLNAWLAANPQFKIADPNTPIVACATIDTNLHRVNGAYCTISYYSGGDRMDTSPMLVNGLPFNAFSNLERAIGYAAECWMQLYPGQEFLLWADQICINQRDLHEKSSQVRMMDEIYKRCQHTFICLDSVEARDTLAWVLDGEGITNISKLETRIRNELAPSQWTSTSISGPPLPSHELDKVEDLDRDVPTGDPSSWLQSLRACLASPWWRRAWCKHPQVLSRSLTNETRRWPISHCLRHLLFETVHAYHGTL
jgi:hypothetical protein